MEYLPSDLFKVLDWFAPQYKSHGLAHSMVQEWSFVGGGEDLRRYWLDYLRRTHVLVYVVDSSDRTRLPLAKTELHRLLRVQPQLPVVILGNKQDKPGAVSVSELHEALSLDAVTDDRKLFLLASQLDSEGAKRKSRQGLDTVHDLLLQLV